MNNPIGTLSSAVSNPAIASSSSVAAQGHKPSQSVKDSNQNPQVPNDKMDVENPKQLINCPIFPEIPIFLEVTG